MKGEPKKVGDLNAQCMQLIGEIIKNVIPEGAGFALVVFDFGETLREFKYISNGQREDMISAFRELVAKWEMEAQKN